MGQAGQGKQKSSDFLNKKNISGHILDLYCIGLLNLAFFCESYMYKALFWCKTLRTGIE